MGVSKPVDQRDSTMPKRQRQNLSRHCTLLGPPVTIAIAASFLHLLPAEVINVFTVWLLASFPIGMLIGHCMLDQE